MLCLFIKYIVFHHLLGILLGLRVITVRKTDIASALMLFIV